MKMKEINSQKNALCIEARYNANVSNFIKKVKGIFNQDKKDFGVLSLLSIMTELGYFEEAQKDTNSTGETAIRRMIDDATKKVDNTFIKDESRGKQL